MNALEWIDNEHGELHAKGDSGHEYQIYQYFHSPCQYGLCVDYSEQDREPQTEEGLKKLHDLANSLEAKFFAALALANGYIRLAADEIVVKRATAEHARRLSDCYHCDDPDCRCGECEADLEAALARGK
jgi:hypothetical protein